MKRADVARLRWLDVNPSEIFLLIPRAATSAAAKFAWAVFVHRFTPYRVP